MCVVSLFLLALTISRCRLHLLPRSIRSFRAPHKSLPLAQSLSSCLALFFEYNLQTPLNARSRFKPPGTRRVLLYQSVKISRSARARARVASVPPSRNSNHPFISTYPPYEILTAGCLRKRTRLSCLVDPEGPSTIRLATLQKPRCNQPA